MRIYGHPQPVVLGVTGHALAAGALLALSCDVRIGGDGPAKIGLNETAIGMGLPHYAVELAQARLSRAPTCAGAPCRPRSTTPPAPSRRATSTASCRPAEVERATIERGPRASAQLPGLRRTATPSSALHRALDRPRRRRSIDDDMADASPLRAAWHR